MNAKFSAGSEDAQETLGERLAAVCEAPCIIFLQGELGAGKTTLVRGFLRGLGHQGIVKSPTYTLIEPYLLPGYSCYHLDLYRVADPGELEYLGLRDFLQADTVLLVEWPERGQGGLPEADLVIDIRYEGDGRTLDLQAGTTRGQELISRLKFDPIFGVARRDRPENPNSPAL